MTQSETSRRVTRLLTFETPAPASKSLAKTEGVETDLPPASPVPPAAKPVTTTTSPASGGNAIEVVLRIRPLSEDEAKRGIGTSLVPSANEKVVRVRPAFPKKHPPAIQSRGYATFKFETIFDGTASQAAVFEGTTLRLVEHLFAGHSCVAFAYGVTASGKTHTIQGTPSDPGILPRALDVIVTSIAKAKGRGLAHDASVSDPVAHLVGDAARRPRRREVKQYLHDANYVDVPRDADYSITASYLEVYNDLVFDLFDGAACHAATEPTSNIFPDDEDVVVFAEPPRAPRRPLRLKERLGPRGEREVHAEGLTRVAVRSAADIERLLEFGCANRTVAHTRQNTSSSRSHAIFEIELRVRAADARTETVSRLQIVDLAGSEKMPNTAAAAAESRQINTSLMNLARCLEELRRNQRVPLKRRVVPFRDSKLTRLLQGALSAGYAVMIATMSPTLSDADETIHTLRNTAVAREVKLRPVARRVKVESWATQPGEMNKVPRTAKKAKQPIQPKVFTDSKKRPTRRALADVSNGLATSVSSPDVGAGRRGEESERENAALREKLCKLHEQVEAAVDDKTKFQNIALKAEDAVCEVYGENQKLLRENEKLFRENERLRERLAHAEAKAHSMEYEIRMEMSEQIDENFAVVTRSYEEQLRSLRAQLYGSSITSDTLSDTHVQAKEPVQTGPDEGVEKESFKRKVMRSSISAFRSIARELRPDDDEEEEEEQVEVEDVEEGGAEGLVDDYTVYEEDE